jgi:hypothetical protein
MQYQIRTIQVYGYGLRFLTSFTLIQYMAGINMDSLPGLEFLARNTMVLIKVGQMTLKLARLGSKSIRIPLPPDRGLVAYMCLAVFPYNIVHCIRVVVPAEVSAQIPSSPAPPLWMLR